LDAFEKEKKVEKREREGRIKEEKEQHMEIVSTQMKDEKEKESRKMEEIDPMDRPSAAVTTEIVATATKRNETETVGGKKHSHSDDLSLESIAATVEGFTPRDLSQDPSTRIRQPEKPLNLYCAARLWATSGLMQERTSKEIATFLSLSDSKAKAAEDAFSNLQALWLQNALNGKHDEARCLGRLFFTRFLNHIRERQCSLKDTSCIGEKIEDQVDNWQPCGARAQLEQLLLMKEVRIGRRSQELPSWTGHVSNTIQDALVRVCVFTRFLSLCTPCNSSVLCVFVCYNDS